MQLREDRAPMNWVAISVGSSKLVGLENTLLVHHHIRLKEEL